jgi:hypothetical protein
MPPKPAKPWLAVVDRFFDGKVLIPYHIEEWVGNKERTAEIDELHKSIKSLARKIESSSISNVEEFEGWVKSVLDVLVG